MEKVAAFDIGSNAIRMTIAALDDKGTLEIINRTRIPLRLGTEAFTQGFFSPSTIAKTANIFADNRKILDQHKVTRLKAMATSAYRSAKNSKDLGQQVFKKSGISIEMISPKKEAMMILKAIQFKVPLQKNHHYLLFDMGGGSIELSALRGQEVLISQSFPLGTVRLLEKMHKEKVKGKNFSLKIKDLILEHDVSFKEFFKAYASTCEPVDMIGTGGNFKRLLKLKRKISGVKDTSVIFPHEVRSFLNKIEPLSFTQRMEKFDLRPDRADVIVPALYLILHVLDLQKIESIYTPDVGLIHGVLFSLLEDRFQKVIERT